MSDGLFEIYGDRKLTLKLPYVRWTVCVAECIGGDGGDGVGCVSGVCLF